MIRTSQSHPLQIATVSAPDVEGRIGITFCPGKKQAFAATGSWERDLTTDVAAMEAWGAAAVVSLVEEHELHDLGVPDLGSAVLRSSLKWIHAPIPDVSTPGPAFERLWDEVGEGLRARLRDGFHVVVHCKGGLGRAGTIAARLLVELGVPAEAALAQVRAARPGAVETEAQESYVLARTPSPEAEPLQTDEAIRDRAVGALLGLAVGDGIGTTLEFRPRDTYEHLTDMVGGGPFQLKPGQWTDDTAMALALADSLAACGGLDEQDLLRRFVSWWREGTYSCTGRCFDIGGTTAGALRRWEETGAAHSGSTSPQSAGNGSLMRLSPVAVRYWNNRSLLRDAAARQSLTTHAAPESVDACVAYAEILADAIAGRERSKVMAVRGDAWRGGVAPILAGSWRGKRRCAVRASGYVLHALEAALWSVGRTATFRDAVLTAANLGEDADTTAAIAGQLAGAIYGAAAIPTEWRTRLAWVERLEDAASKLFRESLTSL